MGVDERESGICAKIVPRETLSLGIALYGYHWYAGDPGIDDKDQRPNITADYISENDVKTLRDTYGAQEQWDAEDHTAYFFFYRDQMREWIFYTDRRGFADRYNLAKEQHLAGTCAWVLGQEDEEIWARSAHFVGDTASRTSFVGWEEISTQQRLRPAVHARARLRADR
jgi:spore germination protein YaaH